MKNNALENRRNLMLNVGLRNRRRNETQNYSEINEVFLMPQVSQRSSLLFFLAFSISIG